MSIHIMRNILGKFNRKPSVLMAFFNKDIQNNVLNLIQDEDIDIRIVSGNYNIYMFITNLIITDDANNQIMETAFKLHCPVLMVSDKTIESTNKNLFIVNANQEHLRTAINNLIYQRFILQ